jgi:hypothetical protein
MFEDYITQLFEAYVPHLGTAEEQCNTALEVGTARSRESYANSRRAFGV